MSHDPTHHHQNQNPHPDDDAHPHHQPHHHVRHRDAHSGRVFIRVGMLVPSRVFVRAGMLGQRPARELLVHPEDRVLRPPRVRHSRASDPGHQHLDRNRLQPPPAPQHPRPDSPGDLRAPRPSPRPSRPLNRCPPNGVNPIKTLPVEQQREAAQRGNRR